VSGVLQVRGCEWWYTNKGLRFWFTL